MPAPKLPTAVKVGLHTYKIAAMTEAESEATSHFGWCDHNRSLIRVQTEGVSDDRLRATLLHEIQHAVWHVMNLRTGMVGLDSGDVEEYLVDTGTNELYRVLRDNPSVRKFIWP